MALWLMIINPATVARERNERLFSSQVVERWRAGQDERGNWIAAVSVPLSPRRRSRSAAVGEQREPAVRLERGVGRQLQLTLPGSLGTAAASVFRINCRKPPTLGLDTENVDSHQTLRSGHPTSESSSWPDSTRCERGDLHQTGCQLQRSSDGASPRSAFPNSPARGDSRLEQ